MLRQFMNLCCLSPKVLLEQLEEEEKPRGNRLTTFTWKTARVSTTAGNLSEFLIPGNILEFHWSSWKFLTAEMTTKASSHKKFSSSQVVWKVVMIMYISHVGYVYLVNRITDLRDCRCAMIVS